MTHSITEPLRLAVGSHEAGSGKGCAMNVISWENGDTTISDLPECADPFLSRVVQGLNDTYCTHRNNDLLCAPCSVVVLEQAHRIVGTGWGWLGRKAVYATIAREEAESVKHLRGSASASAFAADAAATAAANAADYAAYAAYAAANAAYAAYAAANAAVRLSRARCIIDRFFELTGLTEGQSQPEATAEAVQKMLVKA